MSNMVFRVLYITGEDVQSYFSFVNREAYALWNRHVLVIKEKIDKINQQLNAEGRDGEGTIEDYRQWIVSVYYFAHEFGMNYVPYDIQCACNTVEDGVGLPRTNWP